MGKKFIGLILILFLGSMVEARSFSKRDKEAFVKAAASYRGKSRMQSYINRGININVKNRAGDTALLAACKNKYFPMQNITYLIQKGANVNLKDRGGNTALLYVCQRISSATPDFVRKMLQRGARVNERNRKGETALMYAVRNGLTQVIRMLIDKGANPAIKDSSGNTAMTYVGKTSTYSYKRAAGDSWRDTDFKVIIKLLKNKGAKVNVPNKTGSTELHYAVQKNRPHIVRELTAVGANPNMKDSKGNITLHYGVEYEYINDPLLEAGANPNIKNNAGSTPFILLARSGQQFKLNTVKSYFSKSKHDIKLDIKDAKGNTALMHAVQHVFHSTTGSLIKMLVDKGANLNLKNNKGLTPLAVAMDGSSFESALYIHKKGGKINQGTKRGRELQFLLATALGDIPEMKRLIGKRVSVRRAKTGELRQPAIFVAAQRGQLQAVKFLVSKGAKVRDVARYRHTPLIIASEKGHLDVVKYLVQKRARINYVGGYLSSMSPLIESCVKGHKDVVTYLLKKRANPNLPNRDGTTPLHYAIVGNSPDIVRLLLQKGANPNQKNKYGATPLGSSANYAKSPRESVKILINYGINLEAPMDIFGSTILMHYGQKGDLEMIKFAMKKGAKVNTANSRKETALTYAIRGKQPAIVRYLLSKGARIQKGNNSTPLIEAVIAGNTESAELILRKGVRINEKNKFGVSPISAAVARKDKPMVELLIRYKVNVKIKDRRGKGLVYKARLNKSEDIVRLLLKAGAPDGGGRRVVSRRVVKTTTTKASFNGNDYINFLKAAKSGKTAVVKSYLTRGMNPNISMAAPGVDPNHTPLMLSAKYGHAEIVKLLIKHKAYVNLPNKKDGNKTALKYAQSRGHGNIVKILKRARAR
ncbi:MAG: hypothetical protein GY754_15960 [bacterium]|nr:hypothetical protein [bacterium]